MVVLGMHRSGTSAVTRILNILGAALPRHVLAASADNETGHWEPSRLVKFHTDVLAELGSAWDDWMPLDVSRLTARRRAEIKARIGEIIADEYGSASRIVVKDPRICRFAPLFLEALADAGLDPECVLIFRNPAEVVGSLARRDGMLRGHAGLLWLRHVLDSEAATRECRRTFVFYGDLLKDWRDELPGSAVRGLPKGWAWPHLTDDAAAQVDRFLNPAQRHHVQSAADILADPFMSGWIADVHDALHQLRRDPTSAAALATFDRVQLEFRMTTPIIAQVQRDFTQWPDDSEPANLELLRYQNARLRAFASEQERHKQAVLDSTSWRLTAPLRRIIEDTTPAQRNFVLRCLKAVWWAATPWKMPARLRCHRERCRAQRLGEAGHTTPL